MIRHRTSCRLILLALIGLLAAGVPARAEDAPVRYDPVPPRIQAVIADAQEQALAVLAMGLLDQANRPGTTAPRLAWPRALLVMLGDVGLKAAAERLATNTVPAIIKRELIAVVASSSHPDADLLLLRAAREPQPGLRMQAAQGLGRSRGGSAVPMLEVLARDPRSGVRAAALRALFSMAGPQARAARLSLPEDIEPILLTERLRRHRQIEDAGPALRELAIRLYRDSHRPRLRMEAARLLAMPATKAPLETLERIVLEMGTDVLGAAFVRAGLHVPLKGYNPLEERLAAISAALTLLGRKDASDAQRERALTRCVEWVADPVPLDPHRDDTIPEDLLRQQLPNIGRPLIPAVLRRMERGPFYFPTHAVNLLRDLGPRAALPLFRRLLLDPAHETAHSSITLALSTWGRVGGEAVARELLAAPLDARLQSEVLQALRREPAAWAIPLLGTYLDHDDDRLDHAARETLEARGEASARTLLIESMFRSPKQIDTRMPGVLRPLDETSWQVLERALKDPRYPYAHAALTSLARPALRSERGLELVHAVKPDLEKPQRVQAYIYALLNQDSLAAARLVRDRWSELPTPPTSLSQLKEARGSAARRVATDLALDVAPEETGTRMLAAIAAALLGKSGHRDAEIHAFWHRLLTGPLDDLRTCALAHMAYRGCPDLTDVLIPMLIAARERRSLIHDSNELDEATRAQQTLSVMRYQPWTKVEDVVIDTALDPHTHPEVRTEAARLAIGRASAPALERMLIWLVGTRSSPSGEVLPPRGASAEGTLQRLVATAVGTAGDASTAGRLYRALFDEHAAFYSAPERLDASIRRQTGFDERVFALALGIVRTGHEPSIRALVEMLFSTPYITFASSSVRLQGADVIRGGPAAGARTSTNLKYLLHRVQDSALVLTPEAVALVRALRGAPDAMLAAALRATLDSSLASGRLATCPDLYLHRVAGGFAAVRGGPARRGAAAVVAEYGENLLPTNGPADFALTQQRVAEFERAGRYARAADLQRSVLQILLQRGYDNSEGHLWSRERARLDALIGCDLARQGLEDQARAAFHRAAMRTPHDPWTRMHSAVARARVGLDAAAAETDARHALTIHARSRNGAALEFVAHLAEVLLAGGKPAEAVRLLEPRLDRKTQLSTWSHHILLAKAYLGTGDERMALRAMRHALIREPGLESTVRADPAFTAWRGNGLLEKVIEDARRQRRE